jgi:hypothetical protein
MLTLVLTTMMTAMPGAGGLNHPGASAVPNFARHNPPNRSDPWVFPDKQSNSVENPNNPDR